MLRGYSVRGTMYRNLRGTLNILNAGCTMYRNLRGTLNAQNDGLLPRDPWISPF